MKKLITIISALAAVFLILAGCTKKDSVTYSGLEAGNIRSGIFTTDNGVEMNVVGNDGKFDVNTERRVLVEYTTRPGTDAKRVDIDVHGLWDALSIPIFSPEELPQETEDSPIEISDAWFNAGYLNLLASVEGQDVSQHLVMASSTFTDSGITLRLYHDGSHDKGAQSGAVQDFFTCMPMNDVVGDYLEYCRSVGKKAATPIPVLLQWTWYALDEKGPVMLYERKGTYNPSASN